MIDVGVLASHVQGIPAASAGGPSHATQITSTGLYSRGCIAERLWPQPLDSHQLIRQYSQQNPRTLEKPKTLFSGVFGARLPSVIQGAATSLEVFPVE